MKKSLFASAAFLLAVLSLAQNPTFYGLNRTKAKPLATSLLYWASADCITYSSGTCSTPSDGTNITTIGDRSGNGRTGTVATGTCTFHTNKINGKPSITTSSCGITLSSVITMTDHNVATIFVVTKQTSATKGDMTACAGSNTGCFKYYQQEGTNLHAVDRQDLNNLGGSTSTGDTSWHQLNVSINNPLSSGCTSCLLFRKDRAADGSLNVTSFRNFTNDIGALLYEPRSSIEFFVGEWAETLIYGANLSSGQKTTTENYLHTKYNQ